MTPHNCKCRDCKHKPHFGERLVGIKQMTHYNDKKCSKLRNKMFRNWVEARYEELLTTREDEAANEKEEQIQTVGRCTNDSFLLFRLSQ